MQPLFVCLFPLSVSFNEIILISNYELFFFVFIFVFHYIFSCFSFEDGELEQCGGIQLAIGVIRERVTFFFFFPLTVTVVLGTFRTFLVP